MLIKKPDIKYEEGSPQPANLTKDQVERYVAKVVEVVDFQPGDSVVELAERFGGTVRYQDLDDWMEHEASIYVHGQFDFDILVPQYTSRARDRFTVAHELGHYFLHSKQGEIPLIANRNGQNNRAEWEANWFAAALLMPADKFKAACGDNPDSSRLGSLFGVSPAAADVRKKVLCCE